MTSSLATPPAASKPRPPIRRRSRVLGALLLPIALVAALVATQQPAAATNPPGPRDPIGAFESAQPGSNGSLQVSGWAADPDALTRNVFVWGILDGHRVAGHYTNVARPRIAAAYHTSPTPGFNMSVALPRTGVHTVCVGVQNVAVGLSRLLGCVVTPLGTRLSSAQLAAHSPRGVVSTISASSNSLRVTGWAAEPDYLARRVEVVLYIDGYSAKTVATVAATAAQQRAGAGPLGAFDITVPVASGAHLGCVWLVNIGFGSNHSLGCHTADTRGGAGTGPVTEPAMNKAVVNEAVKHIGQRYVWGAAGPKTFDCSGLVTYSYAKAGLSGIAHQSGMQFNRARLIPASRAVPGDLVFYHDGVGSVYHVGIYLSPGDTVAAIDEAEGVAHQHIWDPSSATYGSLTHT